jgi:hypothetical protein
MGEAGKRRVNNQFSIERMVADHQQLYQALAQVDGGPAA